VWRSLALWYSRHRDWLRWLLCKKWWDLLTKGLFKPFSSHQTEKRPAGAGIWRGLPNCTWLCRSKRNRSKCVLGGLVKNGHAESPSYATVDRFLTHFTGESESCYQILRDYFPPEENQKAISFRFLQRYPKPYFEFHVIMTYWPLLPMWGSDGYMALLKFIRQSMDLAKEPVNAPLESVIAWSKTYWFEINAQERKSTELSRLVEQSLATYPSKQTRGWRKCSSPKLRESMPMENNKKNLYFPMICMPERFGRKRKVCTRQNSVKANFLKNLEELGIVLRKGRAH